MKCDDVKKFKYVITDKVHNIRYEIYSNRQMTKQEKIMQIRMKYYEMDCNLPEPDSIIMIITND